MSKMGRGIVLAILVLIFLTGVTLDRFWETRARMPSDALRQDSPTPSDTAGGPVRAYFDPDADTEIVVRLGGIRIPTAPEESVVPDDIDRRAGSPGRSGASTSETDAASSRRETHDRDRGASARTGPGAAPEGSSGATPPRPRPIEHTVQPNETLSHIAQQYLGSAAEWPRISELNGITEATELRAGQTILIPVD